MAGNPHFLAFKGRPEPAIGLRCRVHRNLNKPGFFSVIADEGEFRGKVLGYARAVCLQQVKLKVVAAAYQRCREQGVRNVHAMAIGRYASCADAPPAAVINAPRRITYQPFVRPWFFDRTDPAQPVEKLAGVWAFGADLLVCQS